MDGKWGFIDTTGSIVLEPEYQGVCSGASTAKTAFVQLSDKEYALIDMSENVLCSGVTEIIGYSDYIGGKSTTPPSGYNIVKNQSGKSDRSVIDELGNRIF